MQENPFAVLSIVALSAPRRGFYTYMITGDSGEDELVRGVERALEADVDLIQLRRKRASGGREIELLAKRIGAISPGARARLLVNDRFDLALEAGGGVHLPEDGFPLDLVRRRAPEGFLVACSTHDASQAISAARRGADFLVFGPIFPTRSKPGHPGVGLEALEEVASSVEIPVFALGGMTPERIAEAAAAGARGVAGISMFEREESLRALARYLERITG